MKPAFLFVLAVCLLAGCAGTGSFIEAEAVSGTVPSYPKVAPYQVMVFMSQSRVHAGYKVLARLNSIGGYATREMLIRAIQAKASQFGADGVILLKVIRERTDLGVEPVPTTPNDLSPETQMAPVTYSDADIYISPEPRMVFEGDALAVRLRP